LPDDPRPYLALAAFLRKAGSPDEAIEVVEAGLSALEIERPEWRLWQELGLAHADAGRDAKAIEWLERVLDFLVAKQKVEPSPDATVCLAQLYKKHGNSARALDLFSLLASGSDLPNLCAYHLESARLLRELGMPDEARRMLTRASELASPTDEAVQTRIATALAELAAPTTG
jgi:tetratricopeptide (TPR) repeat protein